MTIKHFVVLPLCCLLMLGSLLGCNSAENEGRDNLPYTVDKPPVETPPASELSENPGSPER